MRRAMIGLAAAVVMASGGAAMGQSVVGLTTGNRLLTFNPATPGVISNDVAISGLQSGESLINIDFRPATGQIVALSSQSRMYFVNAATGAATPADPAGNAFTPALQAVVGGPLVVHGIDINPTVDRLRVVNASAQNRRLNPLTGQSVSPGSAGTFDSDLTWAAGSGQTGSPSAVSTAYTNSIFGAPAGSTRQYIIDASRGLLGEVGSQAGGNASFNGGVVTPVGLLSLGGTPLGFGDLVGFDVFGAGGPSLVSLNLNSGGATGLFGINLSSGALTSLGSIGGGTTVRDIAIVPAPGTLAGLVLGGLVAVRRRR